MYHATGIGLAVLTPAAFLLPATATMPFDMLLGVLFPLHGHVAMNHVVTDYVPKGARAGARGALLLCSVVAAIGLTKLNLQGDGVTGTVKALWAKKQPADKK